jgi:hypothetical protein
VRERKKVFGRSFKKKMFVQNTPNEGKKKGFTPHQNELSVTD